MRIRFDGKTVAVSGAGHGFGRCIAETFAQRGARVFGCDLSAAELAETATAGVEGEVVDLSDRVAAAAWIARIEQTTSGDRGLRHGRRHYAAQPSRTSGFSRRERPAPRADLRARP